MFKKFRIKHEGFHRLAIIVGVLTILFTPWAIEVFDRGFRFSYFFVYFEMWACALSDECSERREFYRFYFLVMHIILYFVGYFVFSFFLWLNKWIREGFKK